MCWGPHGERTMGRRLQSTRGAFDLRYRRSSGWALRLQLACLLSGHLWTTVAGLAGVWSGRPANAWMACWRASRSAAPCCSSLANSRWFWACICRICSSNMVAMSGWTGYADGLNWDDRGGGTGGVDLTGGRAAGWVGASSGRALRPCDVVRRVMNMSCEWSSLEDKPGPVEGRGERLGPSTASEVIVVLIRGVGASSPGGKPLRSSRGLQRCAAWLLHMRAPYTRGRHMPVLASWTQVHASFPLAGSRFLGGSHAVECRSPFPRRRTREEKLIVSQN